MVQLNTEFAGRTYHSPFMNASGVHCGLHKLLDDLVGSEAATYVTKSATVEKRSGNPDPRYYNSNQNIERAMYFYRDYLCWALSDIGIHSL